MERLKAERDYGLDALRGLAIVAMVAPHLARDVLAAPHPFWLRIWSSVAAPVFVTITGMLVAQTRKHKDYPFSHYLSRGALILLTAALVDMLLWGMYPFVGVDVLYLIGVAGALTVLFVLPSAGWQIAMMAGWLALAEVLRSLLGYPRSVLEMWLSDPPSDMISDFPKIVNQWLVSGWFPLFPWLFFSFLGARIFQWRDAAGAGFRRQSQLAGLGLAAFGLLCGWFLPSPLYERAGYTELFYPPTTAYMLIAAGGVLLVFSFAGDFCLKSNWPLILFGQCSLLMYVVHLALIHWVLAPRFKDGDLSEFLALYVGLLAGLAVLAAVVKAVKWRFGRQLPFLVRFILGG